MKWLDKIWWLGLETLVVAQVPADDAGEFLLLKVRKNGDKVKVVSAAKHLGQAEALAALDKSGRAPVILLPAGAAIMERLLTRDQLQEPASAVLGVGVSDPEAFEVMAFPIDAHHVWTAIMRHDGLENYLNRLGRHRARVVSATLSPIVGMLLLPAATRLQGQWTMAGVCFRCANGLPSLISCEPVQHLETISLGAALDHSFAWAYASAIAAWMTAPQQDAMIPLRATWHNHIATSKMRQLVSVAGIALLLWFGALSSWRIQGQRRLSELEENYSLNLPVINAIHALDERIAARQSMARALGNGTLRPSQASFFLDRIAAAAPSGIRLSEVVYGPDEDDLKRLGLEPRANTTLLIAGEASQSSPIAAFSSALDSLACLDHVQVERSEFDFQSEQYQFVFQAVPSGAVVPTNSEQP